MVRLNKIYTRTGDDGTTGLVDGSRQPKHAPRLEAVGAVDEANSVLGWAMLGLDPVTAADIQRIQNDLFDLGADLATPLGVLGGEYFAPSEMVLRIVAAHLGLRVRERRFQVQQLLSYLDSVRHSLVIVLGDFNDWLPGRTAAHVLDQRLGAAARLRSFPSSRPVLPLDRIWIRPVSLLRRMFVHTSALARRASDHLPVVADLDLRPTTMASTQQ